MLRHVGANEFVSMLKKRRLICSDIFINENIKLLLGFIKIGTTIGTMTCQTQVSLTVWRDNSTMPSAEICTRAAHTGKDNKNRGEGCRDTSHFMPSTHSKSWHVNLTVLP